MEARRLSREIEKLKKRILVLSAEVERALQRAVESVTEQRADLAQAVIDGDEEIDRQEVDLEEECLKLLALHQPVAIDLRFIVAVLKINSDLERIGDLAVNIAQRTLMLAASPGLATIFDFREMADRVQQMLRSSLDALVNLDTPLAYDVIASDDEVDVMNRQMYKRAADAIMQNPEQADRLIMLLSVSRLLERVSDHATNIAEDIVYLSSGEIIRHSRAFQRAASTAPVE
ncbi:MAG: phosphate signaling complex protein PhoU [Polyangia bacterium]|jgi:phosphate transport system protein|nr:phosphate signaling complex protein PhoU [Polyangia bacterium]